MEELTMCGYRCDLCRAYAGNVATRDQRAEQIRIWEKYYGGFQDATPESVYCEGCRCDKPDARRIDAGCPVRACVSAKGIAHCGDCADYPCDTHEQRRGLSREDARRKAGDAFNDAEYEGFLTAFDNKTRLDAYRKGKGL